MTMDLAIEGDIINVQTGEIIHGEVGINNDIIASVSFNESIKAKERIEANYIAPGFIEGHIHIESSLLSPISFSKVVIPHGTTTVVAGPHELANVLGYKGVEYFSEESRKSPLKIFIDVPSCVPASSYEYHGVELNSEDIESIFSDIPEAISLGEVMDVDGVLKEDEEILRKIEVAKNLGRIVNGHAPGLSGRTLSEYLSHGIRSDHETTRPEESLEKLRMGMQVMAREGSTEENLEEVLEPVINNDIDSRNVSMVSDDRNVTYLIENGHLDYSLKKAVSYGLDPVEAIQMVTINTAQYFNFDELGRIAPGNKADLVTIKNLEEFNVNKVFIDGELVAKEGTKVFNEPNYDPPQYVKKTMGNFKIKPNDLIIKTGSDTEQEKVKVRTIEVLDNQVITKNTEKTLKLNNKKITSDTSKDVLKTSIIQRNGKKLFNGFSKGFKMKKGAIASSIAHDAHNIIGVGTNNQDLATALNKVKAMEGGLAIAKNGKIIDKLKLEIGGLMSRKNPEEVMKKEKKLNNSYKELGGKLNHPFMTLSFIGLSVIPELKITPQGLVKINPESNEAKIVPLIVD